MHKRIYLANKARQTFLLFVVLLLSNKAVALVDFDLRGGIATKNLSNSKFSGDVQSLSGINIAAELDIAVLPINFTITYYDLDSEDTNTTIENQHASTELVVRETHIGINKGFGLTDLFRPYLGLGVVNGTLEYTQKVINIKTKTSSDTSGYFGSIGIQVTLIAIQTGIDYRQVWLHGENTLDDFGDLHGSNTSIFIGYSW